MLSKEDGPINNEKDSKRVYGRTGSQGWGKTKISSLTPYPQWDQPRQAPYPLAHTPSAYALAASHPSVCPGYDWAQLAHYFAYSSPFNP